MLFVFKYISIRTKVKYIYFLFTNTKRFVVTVIQSEEIKGLACALPINITSGQRHWNPVIEVRCFGCFSRWPRMRYIISHCNFVILDGDFFRYFQWKTSSFPCVGVLVDVSTISQDLSGLWSTYFAREQTHYFPQTTCTNLIFQIRNSSPNELCLDVLCW